MLTLPAGSGVGQAGAEVRGAAATTYPVPAWPVRMHVLAVLGRGHW